MAGTCGVSRFEELLDQTRRPRVACLVLDDPASRAAIPATAQRPRRPRRPRSPCTRPARLIILRCGSVQSFLSVSSRMFAHSRADGRWRFSGLAFQSAERSASRSSARPRGSPAACGSASPAGSEPGNRGSVGSTLARVVVCLILAGGTFRVGGRDQAKLGVEDVDQVVEVPGAVAYPDASSNSWRPIASVP